MIGVVRILAVLAGVAVAGCQTDGLVGSEASGAAKPRAIDTLKTAPRTTVSKKDSGAVAQGDVSARSTTANDDRASARTIQTAAASPGASAPPGGDTVAIPAQSLFGNWTLVDNSGRKCRLILGGVLVGAAYSARGEADCPQAFTTVQSWEIQGPELILRNQSRGIVGRLQPTGPARFDGHADGGAVYLVR
jgi:hypothetical protein